MRIDDLVSSIINLGEEHILSLHIQGFSSNWNVPGWLPAGFWRVSQSCPPLVTVLLGWTNWLNHRNIIHPFLVVFFVHVNLLLKWILAIDQHRYFSLNEVRQLKILNSKHHFTSTISTSMAIPRPTNVAMNTPPRDRSVIPSESSRTGHKLRRVLFQYFPNKLSNLLHLNRWWVF